MNNVRQRHFVVLYLTEGKNMINSITNKQETTITLGSEIAIGQFGQVKETATPGEYKVIKLAHNWDGDNYGFAYLFVHESVEEKPQDVLKTIDFVGKAQVDDGYGLISVTDDSFEAIDKAWYTATNESTGFVTDEERGLLFDIYANEDRTVFLLDGDSIYLHFLLWPKWMKLEDQGPIERIWRWGYDDSRLFVSYYDEKDEFQIDDVIVLDKQRKIDAIIAKMVDVMNA